MIDYELLRKRRDNYLKQQKPAAAQQQIGLAYVHTVDGIQYPVIACFSIGEERQGAKDKLRYLINGQKR